ncbi:hypothetical protein EDD16DRAFT_1247483 [Pisolithus croceorrhizus]|nr:hypothetical protein EDD16DRAFT_1247483 [Pisolithus croceorrhizus]
MTGHTVKDPHRLTLLIKYRERALQRSWRPGPHSLSGSSLIHPSRPPISLLSLIPSSLPLSFLLHPHVAVPSRRRGRPDRWFRIRHSDWYRCRFVFATSTSFTTSTATATPFAIVVTSFSTSLPAPSDLRFGSQSRRIRVIKRLMGVVTILMSLGISALIKSA